MAKAIIESELMLIDKVISVLVRRFGKENTAKFIQLMLADKFSDREFVLQKEREALRKKFERVPIG
jgi:hypothetical protein